LIIAVVHRGIKDGDTIDVAKIYALICRPILVGVFQKSILLEKSNQGSILSTFHRQFFCQYILGYLTGIQQ
jgi:hypothetical protein